MFIRAQAECDALKETATTHTDPVLNVLEPLLHGRIGEPLPPDEYDKAVKEAQERADEGYRRDTRTSAPRNLSWLPVITFCGSSSWRRPGTVGATFCWSPGT
ncbi:hypothetical protein [Streptomyces sp. NPDC007007]|uniref:hypothetical protein n=1 Tax=Streptomyces sp. NPDC007007 TaxID=3364770 RepID=UPI00369E22FE